MPILDVPISVGALASADEVRHRANDARLINGYVDQNGYIHKFPGYALLGSTGTNGPVNGIFCYRDTYSDDVIALWIASGGILTVDLAASGIASTVDTASYLNTVAINKSGPVRMDYYRPTGYNGYLIVADGAGAPLIMFYVSSAIGSATTGRIIDNEAPRPCTHTVQLNNYLIGNNRGEQYFDISYPSDYTRWDGDFAQAQSRPDDITALAQSRRKLIVAGYESIEVWHNDGVTPWAPDYNHIDGGLHAKDSFLACANELYWIDADKRLVSVDIAAGLTPLPVSTTLNAKIASSPTAVDDCLGGYLKTGDKRFYIANFETFGRTFCVDTATRNWAELGRWNAARGEYDQFELTTFTSHPQLGAVAGSRLTDKYYRVGPQYTTFNGEDIRTMIRTPTITWGTTDRKIVRRLLISAQRTADKTDAITIDPVLRVRWRDDGSTDWLPWRDAALSPTGNTTFQVEINRCGSYRSRQYEILMLGDYPYCIKYLKEDQR